MTARAKQRPAAIRMVIPFVFRHWLAQPVRATTVAGGLLGATVADLFMPLFSGHLVDALTMGATDPATRRAAWTAFGAIVALGLASMTLRLIALYRAGRARLQRLGHQGRRHAGRCPDLQRGGEIVR